MTYAERHLVETYAKLFDRLSALGKLELLNKLAKSIKKQEKSRSEDFYLSFGAFQSDNSAEELVSEIKQSRNFKERDIIF